MDKKVTASGVGGSAACEVAELLASGNFFLNVVVVGITISVGCYVLCALVASMCLGSGKIASYWMFCLGRQPCGVHLVAPAGGILGVPLGCWQFCFDAEVG
ncbi:hypothetical protein Nepgr_013505 [Nepenthes gracilis]|uniref:Transmembrane protein n=1 Tax=Nepenthes gracilis TaxID=150966 RepID=A0AAD3SJ17_NEPGR|nr:hypothetical protein Nepgr_013505 [Nepenthes gracilis]